MDAHDGIEGDVLGPNEFALPLNAAVIVERALNHEEVTFVLDTPDCVTFITLRTDGTWEAEQS